MASIFKDIAKRPHRDGGKRYRKASPNATRKIAAESPFLRYGDLN
jgi:hypothetical protein